MEVFFTSRGRVEQLEDDLQRVELELSEERSSFLQVSSSLAQATGNLTAQQLRHSNTCRHLQQRLQEEQAHRLQLTQQLQGARQQQQLHLLPDAADALLSGEQDLACTSSNLSPAPEVIQPHQQATALEASSVACLRAQESLASRQAQLHLARLPRATLQLHTAIETAAAEAVALETAAAATEGNRRQLPLPLETAAAEGTNKSSSCQQLQDTERKSPVDDHRATLVQLREANTRLLGDKEVLLLKGGGGWGGVVIEWGVIVWSRLWWGRMRLVIVEWSGLWWGRMGYSRGGWVELG